MLLRPAPALALLLAFLLATPMLHAQDAEPPAEPQRVELVDGGVLVGVVAEETDEAVVLVSENGLTTTIPRDRIRTVGPLLERGFERYDPIGTRLFLAPTGRTMGQGTGRISGYYLFPSVAYSPLDRLDLSFASTIPASGIGAIMNFNVKGQVVRSERVQAALGANAFVPVGGEAGTPGVGGTIYGVVTAGGPTSAVTVGLFGVYGTDFDDVEFGEGVVVLGGYERQLSNSVKLISENYVGIGSGATGGTSLAGVRFFGDRLAADLALALAWGDGEVQTIPVPYVGFSYTFGR